MMPVYIGLKNCQTRPITKLVHYRSRSQLEISFDRHGNVFVVHIYFGLSQSTIENKIPNGMSTSKPFYTYILLQYDISELSTTAAT